MGAGFLNEGGTERSEPTPTASIENHCTQEVRNKHFSNITKQNCQTLAKNCFSVNAGQLTWDDLVIFALFKTQWSYVNTSKL